jgi:glucose-1-phosphate adenylyltransferase
VSHALIQSHSKMEKELVPVDMHRVVCVILGGGQGSRLYPLTETKCKPAIWFGGRYRLIDVPVSNAVNSGCYKIAILTQFLSSSLHRHILQTYHMDQFSSGFIDVLAAEQTPTSKEWFQGTADAVRQNYHSLVDIAADYFLILSGDQLYNMDFRKMIAFAEEREADLVIGAIPVDKDQASRMGLLKINEKKEIVDFVEKPDDPKILNDFKIPGSSDCLASMGIYCFKRDLLFSILDEHEGVDFGKHLIPHQVEHGGAYAYPHDGYWEDIGTIKSFYEANIALTEPLPRFNCYDEINPIFAQQTQLPGPKIFDTKITHSIICEGAIVEAKEITHSIIGPKTILRKGSVVEYSYIMGNEQYEPPVKDSPHYPKSMGIGENCVIRKAIIDKNVYMGDGVKLINEKGLDHYDSDDHLFVRDGVIVVTRGASFPDGFTF